MRMRPNVIVFLSDDQGYGDLGIFGNPDLKTPHIDRMAHEGVRLTQHYSGSPLCAPARASLLTGRYNHRTGALSVESNRGLDRISVREQTVADLFQFRRKSRFPFLRLVSLIAVLFRWNRWTRSQFSGSMIRSNSGN